MRAGPATAAARAIVEAAAGTREQVVATCRELLRIPSPSGDEERVARYVAKRMEDLGFHDVEIDRAGNVLGTVRANAKDRLPGCVLLDAHLDHVDPGAAATWSRPPFEAVIDDGRLYGRGASDTKSAVAAQVEAVALLARLDVPRRRDLVVAAVVQEEVGGLGTATLLDSGLEIAFAVIGEPSDGALAFGHRGRVELEACFQGRAAHAARPDRGVNPHFALARFVSRMGELRHDADPRLGVSTAVPTLVRVSPQSPNVIPDEVALTIDWRHVPSERPEDVRQRVAALAHECARDGVSAEVRVPTRRLRSWTGLERDVERVSRSFATPEGSPALAAAHAALEGGLGRQVQVVAWDFASDGGWLHASGVPCVGYGPGQVAAMHVVDESVSVDLLAESVAGYALIAAALDGLEGPNQ